MRRLPKYLRVAAAAACFLSVNAAFLAPVVAETLCLDSSPDFSWAAKMQFLPALLALNLAVVAAILAATALFGRVYCSTVCPLGVLQDIVIRIRRLFTGKQRAANPPRLRWRVALVGAFAALAALGFLSLAAQLDPYSVYGRCALPFSASRTSARHGATRTRNTGSWAWRWPSRRFRRSSCPSPPRLRLPRSPSGRDAGSATGCAL